MAERLIRLENPQRAAVLFDGWQETLIWSALEGEMGCIWALSETPKAALCENADFLFLAGSADEPETRLLLECWRQEKGRFEILVPREKECGAVIETVFPNAESENRYAFHKGGEHFDSAFGKTVSITAPHSFSRGTRISILPFS